MEKIAQKTTISIIFFLNCLVLLFSETKVSITSNNQIVTIDFPYDKLEGVSEIYANERRALVIDEIKTDEGKTIKGDYKFFWFGADEGYASGNVECDEKEFSTFLATKWSVSTKKGKHSLCYSSLVRRHPTEYQISEDISNVIVTYHVLFPDGSSTNQYTQIIAFDWLVNTIVSLNNLEITVFGLNSFNSKDSEQLFF